MASATRKFVIAIAAAAGVVLQIAWAAALAYPIALLVGNAAGVFSGN